MKPKAPHASQISCSEGGSAYSFKVGDMFFYEFYRHESVGKEVEFQIGDTQIVSHVDTRKEYVHPENMKPGWTGGDLQKGQWLFRANALGITPVVIRSVFRGRLESECRIDITVT